MSNQYHCHLCGSLVGDDLRQSIGFRSQVRSWSATRQCKKLEHLLLGCIRRALNIFHTSATFCILSIECWRLQFTFSVSDGMESRCDQNYSLPLHSSWLKKGTFVLLRHTHGWYTFISALFRTLCWKPVDSTLIFQFVSVALILYVCTQYSYYVACFILLWSVHGFLYRSDRSSCSYAAPQ